MDKPGKRLPILIARDQLNREIMFPVPVRG